MWRSNKDREVEEFFEFLTSRPHSYTPTCIRYYHVKFGVDWGQSWQKCSSDIGIFQADITREA